MWSAIAQSTTRREPRSITLAREVAPAACRECGAWDLDGDADPHECQLSNAYNLIGDGALLYQSCFEMAADHARGE
jgi:hypothetical protein